jgi:hypothetical protein
VTAESPEWPEDLIPASSVRDWIRAQLHLTTQPDGPLRTLASDSTSVAAIFSTDGDHAWIQEDMPTWMSKPLLTPNPQNAIFFKACLKTQLANSPMIYSFLTELAPQYVPHLIASTASEEQTWMLFDYINAPTVEELESFDRLVEATGVLAHVQGLVAEHPVDEGTGIETILLPDLIQLYDQVRQFAIAAHDTETVQMLNDYRADFIRWVHELESQNWPLSITHTDLHTKNILVPPLGDIILADWDGCNLACPFLTLETLILQASLFQPAAERVVSAEVPFAAPWLLKLFSAYLTRLPWGTWLQRQRALSLGIAISPIKYIIDTANKDHAGAAPSQAFLRAVLIPGSTRWRLMRSHDRVFVEIAEESHT